MPLDPQAEAFLAQFKDAPPLSELPIEFLRSQSLVPQTASAPMAAVVDRTIPADGYDLPVRIYVPREERALPLLVYFHGGGWVVGNLDTHDGACREAAAQADCVVLSVDYRLAPEHKFPAAVEDCLAATRWAAAHAEELGIDATRIAVGGDSAGGNLAAVVALRVRDEGGPPLRGQLLIYPVTAYHTPPSASLIENGEGYFLTRADMAWFSGHYLPDESYALHPHFAVLHVEDLAGLPPAHLITAQYDPLRDEGEAYGDRLGAAGVAVEARRYDGMVHGFFGMAGMDQGAVALARAAGWLKRVFA